LLLAMRVLALLLIGAAFARPVWTPSRRAVLRVIAVDHSRAVRDPGAARDSALALLRQGDVLVLFDSAARAVRGHERDSLGAMQASTVAGTLSAAMVAASRAAAPLRDRADSLELVIVSPLAREEWSASTPAIRRTWPGRARLVRLARADSALPRERPELRAADERDPVRAALSLRTARVATPVRIDRGDPSDADTMWAAAGNVLVRWPAAPERTAWPRRVRPDSIGAVAAGDDVIVAPFARVLAPPAGRAVARWADGEPAAAERAVGRGCVRDVAVPLPVAGDVALRESTRRFLAAIVESCGGARDLAPLDSASLDVLRGPAALASARAMDATGPERETLAVWLLASAALLLLAELFVRARRSAP
jgi:hypothetical protein